MSVSIRCCPVAAVVASQQLLARQLHVLAQQHIASQHHSLEHSAAICQPQQVSSVRQPQNGFDIPNMQHQLGLPGTALRCKGLLPRVGACTAGMLSSNSSCGVASSTWQFQRHYAARPCSEAVEDELAAAASPSRRRRSRTTISRDAAATAAEAAAAAADVDATQPTAEATADVAAGSAAPSRRRGTTESRALLRRTTESRAAIEDVAVMSKSQLMRRNKAWLQHECWTRQLRYDGLKPDLVQQLLEWQETEAGQEAAAVALANAEVARAAAAGAEEGLQEEQGAEQQQYDSIDSSSSGSRRRRRSTNSAAVAGSSNITGEGQASAGGADADVAPYEQPQQPPRNAAAAAADSLTALLQQLQEQPDNAALLAVARNSLELHVKGLMANTHIVDSSSSTAGSSWQSFTGSRGWGGVAAAAAAAAAAASRTAALQEAAADLASRIQTASSPASIAALATACYSREVQSPVLAAAMSEAVASVAPQLGPQEVYRVLRLLVEHLGESDVSNSVTNSDVMAAAAGWATGEAGSTLRRGFQVLAQALISCCSALAPMQLAEAVALLARHQYDDAWGLWLISKEAADRLAEFEPCDMVLLLDAVAGMCVADDALCRGVAEAVAAKRDAYSGPQLAEVGRSLQRMGYTGQV